MVAFVSLNTNRGVGVRPGGSKELDQNLPPHSPTLHQSLQGPGPPGPQDLPADRISVLEECQMSSVFLGDLGAQEHLTSKPQQRNFSLTAVV